MSHPDLRSARGVTSVRAQLCVPARERVWWVMNEKGLLHYGRETRKMEPALWIGVAIAVIASLVVFWLTYQDIGKK